MSSRNDKLDQARRQISNDNKAAARDILREYLKENPQDAEAWYLAGQAAANPTQAIAALERAIKIDPMHDHASELLERLKRNVDVSVSSPSWMTPPTADFATTTQPAQTLVQGKRQQPTCLQRIVIVVVFVAVCGIIVQMSQNSPKGSSKDTPPSAINVVIVATSDQRSTPKPDSGKAATQLPQVTATPQPTDRPHPTNTPEQGTRSNPFTLGSPGSIRDGRLQISSIKRNQSAAVNKMNMFNTKPGSDEEWVLVDVTFYCDLSADKTCNASQIFFELVGLNGEIYQVPPLTVTDNNFGAEIYGGGQTSGLVGFIVKKSDKNLMLVVNDIGTRTFFATGA